MTTSAEQIRLRSPAACAEYAKSETPAASPAAIQLLEFILSSSVIPASPRRSPLQACAKSGMEENHVSTALFVQGQICADVAIARHCTSVRRTVQQLKRL